MAGINIPFINSQTGTNLSGLLSGEDGKINAADQATVRSSAGLDPDGVYLTQSQIDAALQAALPAPLAIEEGRVYTVQENQQVAFRFPIAVDGILRVDGILYEV